MKPETWHIHLTPTLIGYRFEKAQRAGRPEAEAIRYNEDMPPHLFRFVYQDEHADPSDSVVSRKGTPHHRILDRAMNGGTVYTVTLPAWDTVIKYTEEPKYSWLLSRFEEHGIPYRRNGYSSHGPICEVPEEYAVAAGSLLEQWGDDDDAPYFYEDNPVKVRTEMYDKAEPWDEQEPEGEPVPFWPENPADPSMRFDEPHEEQTAEIEHAGRLFVVYYDPGEESFYFQEEAPAPRHLDPYTSDIYSADSLEDATEEARRLIARYFPEGE